MPLELSYHISEIVLLPIGRRYCWFRGVRFPNPQSRAPNPNTVLRQRTHAWIECTTRPASAAKGADLDRSKFIPARTTLPHVVIYAPSDIFSLGISEGGPRECPIEVIKNEHLHLCLGRCLLSPILHRADQVAQGRKQASAGLFQSLPVGIAILSLNSRSKSASSSSLSPSWAARLCSASRLAASSTNCANVASTVARSFSRL